MDKSYHHFGVWGVGMSQSKNLKYKTKRFVGDANRPPEVMMAQFLNANNIPASNVVSVTAVTVDTTYMIDRTPINDIILILLYMDYENPFGQAF